MYTVLDLWLQDSLTPQQHFLYFSSFWFQCDSESPINIPLQSSNLLVMYAWIIFFLDQRLERSPLIWWQWQMVEWRFCDVVEICCVLSSVSPCPKDEYFCFVFKWQKKKKKIKLSSFMVCLRMTWESGRLNYSGSRLDPSGTPYMMFFTSNVIELGHRLSLGTTSAWSTAFNWHCGEAIWNWIESVCLVCHYNLMSAISVQ